MNPSVVLRAKYESDATHGVSKAFNTGAKRKSMVWLPIHSAILQWMLLTCSQCYGTSCARRIVSEKTICEFFLAYVRRMNSLRERPEWYSAITHNCTTSIRMQRAAADRVPWDWRMLANGHGDELLYERGMIATNLPLAELKQRSHINARAKPADKEGDFSRRIRQGVPGIEL
jgi:hypothetical protein